MFSRAFSINLITHMYLVRLNSNRSQGRQLNEHEIGQDHRILKINWI